MNNNKSYNTIYLIAGIILIGAISRIIPHAPNFTAMGAIALFGGRYINNERLKYIIPIGAMVLSDIALKSIGINLPSWKVQVTIYLSFSLIVLMGDIFIKSKQPKSIIITSLGASTLFFLLSNLAVWANGGYGYSIEGLITCYVMAIPFLSNTILGDLTYCAILFGAYQYITISSPAFSKK